jgi:2-phosphosulfolactate phosphatase
LSETVCVVFDILRATTSMVTALGNGAGKIIPVLEIEDAVRLRRECSEAVLAGERQGLRILAAQSGGVDFDLGNSPREFTPEAVRGKTLVMTTTNGTRALRACEGARSILASAFLNLRATARWIQRNPAGRLLLVCAGTFEEAAYEDTLAACALCDELDQRGLLTETADSAEIARQIYRAAGPALEEAMRFSRNARRLRAIPELREDVSFSLRRDTLEFAAGMRDGAVGPF